MVIYQTSPIIARKNGEAEAYTHERQKAHRYEKYQQPTSEILSDNSTTMLII